jgi:cytochrome c-type biogenesis protein CcmE
MSHKAAKVGLTSLILVLAFGGLLYSTLSEGTEYYKHVDEVLANPHEWQGKRLQVHGFAKDVRQKPGTLEYRFDVENNGKVIRAYYTGITPDTFKNDAEVVIKGSLQPDGTFIVNEDGIMAKCPSKYEPKDISSTGAE